MNNKNPKTSKFTLFALVFMAGIAFHAMTGQPRIVKVAHAVEDPRCQILEAPRV